MAKIANPVRFSDYFSVGIPGQTSNPKAKEVQYAPTDNLH
jgi:hypothetical protein